VKERRKERRKPRSYSMEFRLEAVTRLLAGESSRGLSRRLDVRTSVLYRWLDKYRQVALQRMGSEITRRPPRRRRRSWPGSESPSWNRRSVGRPWSWIF